MVRYQQELHEKDRHNLNKDVGKTYHNLLPSCQTLDYCAPLCFYPHHQHSSSPCHLQYCSEPAGGGNEQMVIKLKKRPHLLDNCCRSKLYEGIDYLTFCVCFTTSCFSANFFHNHSCVQQYCRFSEMILVKDSNFLFIFTKQVQISLYIKMY